MTTATTIMDDPTALQRLLTWLSPAFPAGAFAYSSGLETAIVEGAVATATTLENWISGNLRHGAARTDAVLLNAAHAAWKDVGTLRDLAELTVALTPARQRVAELETVGNAFVAAASAWPDPVLARLPAPCPYPVAVGAIAAAHGVGARDTLTAFLTAYVQSQISVAIRLVPLGQTEGLRVQAALEATIAACATRAAESTLDDLGNIGYASDIAAMRHEILHSRIFRS